MTQNDATPDSTTNQIANFDPASEPNISLTQGGMGIASPPNYNPAPLPEPNQSIQQPNITLPYGSSGYVPYRPDLPNFFGPPETAPYSPYPAQLPNQSIQDPNLQIINPYWPIPDQQPTFDPDLGGVPLPNNYDPNKEFEEFLHLVPPDEGPKEPYDTDTTEPEGLGGIAGPPPVELSGPLSWDPASDEHGANFSSDPVYDVQGTDLVTNYDPAHSTQDANLVASYDPSHDIQAASYNPTHDVHSVDPAAGYDPANDVQAVDLG